MMNYEREEAMRAQEATEEMIRMRTPTQGPSVARTRPRSPHDFSRFDQLLNRLEQWRNDDHNDNLVLSRTYVIEIIEGIKALRRS
jgi:hypothetical protein